MTRSQYWLLLLLSFISFALAATLLGLHFQNQRAETGLNADQTKMTKLQEELQRGEISRRMVQTIAQDLSVLAAQKPEVQNLLARYGITIRKNGEADSK